MTLAYSMTFAGIPFALDKAKVFRLTTKGPTQQGDSGGPPVPQQEDVDLVDELNKKIPFDRLDDVQPTSPYPGRGLLGIGMQEPIGKNPYCNVKIGEWYYPATASRWSIFRGLATSTMVKRMLASTLYDPDGLQTSLLEVKCFPSNLSGAVQSNYSIQSYMHMLPPRPLGEMGGKFDGLYLVTLVDSRYYWQDTPVTLNVTWQTTWSSLIAQLSTALNATISVYSSIESVYASPEPDSALWCSNENAPILLDCVAANIGRTVVRNLDGTYTLYTPAESRAIVTTNQTRSKDVRVAGGDMFQTGTRLPVGDLSAAKNSVVPTTVYVSFPKYVTGNDPVPHFVNTKYGAQRPTSWNEDAYSDVYTVAVPIASGGPYVSGLFGTSTVALRDTAKAFYPDEIETVPTNASGLTSLAIQLARNLYENQVAAALDEVYPGTLQWTPEGFHDLIWTYSAKAGGAFLRVLKTPWNSLVRDFQHAPAALTGYTQIPAGIGGHSVAQVHMDSVSDTPQTTLSASLDSTSTVFYVSDSSTFPQNTRWKAQIDSEIMLCEGFGGNNFCTVVYRGIDNTLQASHSSGATVTQLTPNKTYGVNLVEYGPGFTASPGRTRAGGIQGVYLDYNIFSSGNFASGEIQSGYIVNDGSTIINNFITNYLNSGSTVNFGSGVVASGYSGYQIIFNQFLNLFWNIASGYTLNIGGSGTINILGMGGASKYEQYFFSADDPAVTVSGNLSGYVYLGGHPRQGFPGSSTATITSGQLVAVPFINGRSGIIINEMVINVAGVPPANARAILGVYENYSVDVMQPGALLYETGEVDVSTTGTKYAPVLAPLGNELYWLVIQSKFLSTYRFLSPSMCPIPILGIDIAGTNASYGWRYDDIYTGSLPLNFSTLCTPLANAGTNNVIPAIGLTFTT